MLCSEIMKTSIECVRPTDTVLVAAQRMRDSNVGFLPVCDDDLHVLGTITDRDIVIRQVAGERPLKTPVDELMTCDVVACSPGDDVRKAEKLMAEHQKSRMMCVDDAGKLVGVLSLSDIAQVEESARAAETMRKITEREVRS